MAFTVLGLEPGEHTLTFVLKTQRGQKDVVEKKLRVVVHTTKHSTQNIQTHTKHEWFTAGLNSHLFFILTKDELVLKNKVCFIIKSA